MTDDMKAAALAGFIAKPKEVLALIARCEAAERERVKREQVGDRAIAQAHVRILETQVTDVIAERDRLRAALELARTGLIQGRGALRLDHMVDENGEPYGTTVVALEAIDEALAAMPAEPAGERGG